LRSVATLNERNKSNTWKSLTSPHDEGIWKEGNCTFY